MPPQAKSAESPVRLRTILVPLLNLSVAPDLLGIAAGLIAGSAKFLPHEARIEVLAVVTVPPGQAPGEGRNMARAYRAMLSYLPQTVSPPGQENAPALQVPVDPLIKVAPSLAEGIRDAVSSEDVDLLLLYWKGYAAHPTEHTFGMHLDALLRDPPCNMMLVRLGEDGPSLNEISRILMPLRGGPTAELALDAGRRLAGRLEAGITLLHAMPAGDDRGHDDAPYLALQHHIEETACGQPVEQVISRTADTQSLVAEQIAPGDLLILGLREPDPHKPLRRGPVLERALADLARVILLARAAHSLDIAAYRARLAEGQTAEIGAERWLVENSYHSDEFADPERRLAAIRERQAHVSIVLPTHNDAARISSILTGLQRSLLAQTENPFADEILVVDAASQDDTPVLAAGLGVPVMRVDQHTGRQRGGTPGPAALLREALNLAMGDILIWVDPKAGRLPPSEVSALVGPLLHDPNLLLVKPFWPPLAASDQGSEAAGPRFIPRTPADLLSMSVPELAQVPPHGWWRAFYPRLGGLLNPSGHAFAARAGHLRELLPTLEDYEGEVEGFAEHGAAVGPTTAFYAGLLLETATHHGTRAIAQVEMRRSTRGKGRTIAAPDLRQLREIAELLGYFALRPDAEQHLHAIEQIRARLLQVSA